MPLILHHLGISQSERIVWLLEELEIPYELVKYTRSPALAPDSLKNVPGNETGKSPFLQDTAAGIALAESGAITDYIIWKHAGGKLAVKPDAPHFADYLYWKDYANATMQPAMLVSMFLSAGKGQGGVDGPVTLLAKERLHGALAHMDRRLQGNKWLAGEEFTAADTMSVYALTTQRYWGPQVSLAPYSALLRWLRDCAERPAFKRAMEKGDPDKKVLLSPDPPSVSMLEANGIEGTHWRK